MEWKNTTTRYGAALIALHWITLLLLVAVYALIELRVIYPSGSPPRELMKAWHFTLGLTVFVLFWVRLGLRVSQPTPRIEPALVRWQQLLSRGVHIALYALMLVMPLLGWLTLSAEGELTLVNGLTLPALIAPNPQYEEVLKEWHEEIGNIGMLLIGLHAIAALFHHYYLRDNTLTRMLPARK